jgi:ABC-type branched-subunit amino acid transport system ATPase component
MVPRSPQLAAPAADPVAPEVAITSFMFTCAKSRAAGRCAARRPRPPSPGRDAENLALGRLARPTTPANDGRSGTVWSEQRIYEMFPRLKARRDVAADYLSGGEQQMAAVARALSGHVKLLLLDEPFEGLAPSVVQELFTVFDRLRGEVSMIIVEHNLDLVLALADRVFAMEHGAVFHTGAAQPLLADLECRKKILWL